MNFKSLRTIAFSWERRGDWARAAEFYGKALKDYLRKHKPEGELFDAITREKQRCEDIVRGAML